MYHHPWNFLHLLPGYFFVNRLFFQYPKMIVDNYSLYVYRCYRFIFTKLILVSTSNVAFPYILVSPSERCVRISRLQRAWTNKKCLCCVCALPCTWIFCRLPKFLDWVISPNFEHWASHVFVFKYIRGYLCVVTWLWTQISGIAMMPIFCLLELSFCVSFSCLLSVFQMSMFFMCLFNCVSTGQNSETLWEIWGRIINDWEPVKKKPAFLKVCQSWHCNPIHNYNQVVGREASDCWINQINEKINKR